MTERRRLDATVHGRVQGVGFRWFIQRIARGLGLVGWTKNQPDGSVRVVAEGSSASLDVLAEQLGKGPAGAVVDRVNAQRAVATGEFGGFEIRAHGHRGD